MSQPTGASSKAATTVIKGKEPTDMADTATENTSFNDKVEDAIWHTVWPAVREAEHKGAWETDLEEVDAGQEESDVDTALKFAVEVYDQLDSVRGIFAEPLRDQSVDFVTSCHYERPWTEGSKFTLRLCLLKDEEAQRSLRVVLQLQKLDCPTFATADRMTWVPIQQVANNPEDMDPWAV